MSEYYFSKVVSLPIDAAVTAATKALLDNGFGVLTDIDVQATLKKKLDVGFRPYRILGACNPAMAYKALQAEDKIGTMLPCNVVVQELAPGRVEIAAVDPAASMQAIDNPGLAEVAGRVRELLRRVVDDIGRAA